MADQGVRDAMREVRTLERRSSAIASYPAALLYGTEGKKREEEEGRRTGRRRR